LRAQKRNTRKDGFMGAESSRPVAIVTGGRGFLGRHVVPALHRAGYFAVTIGPARPGDTDRHCPLDRLDDTRALAEIFQKSRPSLVVHLAAAPPPAGPAMHQQVTVAGTRALIAALADAPNAQLLSVGSAAEFGTQLPEAGLLTDDYPCRPVTHYGQAKHKATQDVLRYRAKGGRASVLRLFTACGSSPPPHSLLGGLVSQLRALPGDGGVMRMTGYERLRDYLPVHDVAAMIVQLAQHGSALPPVMNLCSGIGISVGQWVEAMIAASGLTVTLEPVPGAIRPEDPPRVVGDPATLIRLGITPPILRLPDMAMEILGESSAG
jgi:nucleoside-diphosphate-sugar epimerase